MKNIKNVSVLAVFAAFAVVAMIGNVTAAAPAANGESVTASIIMPVTQELPFDRYWSKD
jgi:hypothetical protein